MEKEEEELTYYKGTRNQQAIGTICCAPRIRRLLLCNNVNLECEFQGLNSHAQKTPVGA